MQPTATILESYAPVLPEIVLAVGAMALLMLGVFRNTDDSDLPGWLAVGLLVVAGIIVLLQGGVERTLFDGAFIIDGFSRFMKILTLTGSAVAIIMSFDYLRQTGLLKFEFPVLIVLATLGMMMMISANDLISLYLGVELQSLALYVIAAFRRGSVRSSEAGLKYFVLGALSSGMLLYGCSLIYGFTGTTGFDGIAASLKDSGAGLGLTFGLVFFLAGLAFKVSAVPFHMWTPDVYEGSPTPVTAFFAAAPKMAAMAMFLRAVLSAFPAITPDWQQIIVFISIASMVLGAFAAIGQQNIKRLMAYSSIGHMGFALVGLAAGNVGGAQSVIIYLTIYLVMTLGVFACILAMKRSDGMVEEIDELAGLSRNNPLMAFMLAMLLFSLAGIPPLAGFFAKFYVFLAAINAELYALAVIGVLASVVGAYYYLRIIKIMYFDEPVERFEPMPGVLQAVLAVSGVLVILFFVYPAPLVAAADTAAKALF
ncbi:MAG: NADH-quinone oxidoreductase subunit NuoN [Hyphomicrobiales bacterium]|nr:NADH-quinone oxidoreductase subunit NuoN [Hyphomicrobiales bacterium]